MSYKTCPDWPELMELAPELQFKHMSVREAQLPFEVVTRIPAELSLDETEMCCDADCHVFFAAHTHPVATSGADPQGGVVTSAGTAAVTTAALAAAKPVKSATVKVKT